MRVNTLNNIRITIGYKEPDGSANATRLDITDFIYLAIEQLKMNRGEEHANGCDNFNITRIELDE